MDAGSGSRQTRKGSGLAVTAKHLKEDSVKRRKRKREEYKRKKAKEIARKKAYWAECKDRFNKKRPEEAAFGKAHLCPDCGIPMYPLALERCGFCTEEKALCLISVSYTHLDVYKRQR